MYRSTPGMMLIQNVCCNVWDRPQKGKSMAYSYWSLGGLLISLSKVMSQHIPSDFLQI